MYYAHYVRRKRIFHFNVGVRSDTGLGGLLWTVRMCTYKISKRIMYKNALKDIHITESPAEMYNKKFEVSIDHHQINNQKASIPRTAAPLPCRAFTLAFIDTRRRMSGIANGKTPSRSPPSLSRRCRSRMRETRPIAFIPTAARLTAPAAATAARLEFRGHRGLSDSVNTSQ